MKEEHRLLLAQPQENSSDGYDQASRRCGEMIAKFWQSGESPERSSSPLVVVVCTPTARLPIQLSMDTCTLFRPAIELLDLAVSPDLP
jgi:hypothetical protein